MNFSHHKGAVRWPLIAGGALLLLVSGGLYAVRERAQRIEARRWAPIVMPERVARVTDAWDAATLGERLEKSGKLKDASLFAQAAQEVGLTEVAEGGYALPAQAGPRELAEVFKAGPTLKKVTFPEGWTAAQIASRLQKEEFAAGGELLKLAYPTPTGVSPLEGRLFPETYYLPIKGAAPEIVKEMRARFDEIWSGFPKDAARRPKVNGKPLTDDEIVVLASLVERESVSPEESPLIAGVLLNRLQKGMRLQCDASVQYARDRAANAGLLEEGHKERLLFRDLEIESPYNTYRNAGLPPGAICNPGAVSIRAALMPRANPNFFYVMSPLLGRHRFAKTFAEHRQNIRLAQRERAAKGKPE
ncbi:MAG TPA: endolytic transglycosylase MltG [Abditibacteriaceae bacterium]|jgi:UPF0755 protein